MQETWRWFGPSDPVSLENIVQAGASGVVTSLHEIPTGEAWNEDQVLARRLEIEAHGLAWTVVESIPLHNDLKTRTGDFSRYLENYKRSLQAVGAAGIPVVCYNFMPVVDWTRTDLMYRLSNASYALRFDMTDFVAYDVHILQRDRATASYSDDVLARAAERFASMTPIQCRGLEDNIIAGLPGGEGSYDREGIRAAIAEFIELGEVGLRSNLLAFLEEIIPVAEQAGVHMAIHPDDPPFSLFGLPRVLSTAEDVRKLRAAIPSPHNGLTLCAGSFGARADNDLVSLAKEFGPVVHFVHLRNVRREADGSFHESEHLDGDNDILGLVSALLEEERRRSADGRVDRIPLRADHGHLLGDEIGRAGVNPGYSFGGRMKGLAELRGVIHALERLQV